MTPPRPPALAVIGAGRVGASIAGAAHEAGRDVRLAGRDDALEAAAGAEVALLCVPDSEIEAACEQIAAAIPPLRYVGHTSGATTLDALSATSSRGAAAFSLHPLQTFPHGDTDVAGCPCAISGQNAAAASVARELALALGMRPFDIPEESRDAYHAAASVASNFLVALEEAAVEILDRLDVDDGRELLAPLVLRTAANWADHGPAALTGPIARGDGQTVERHRRALAELDSELLRLYDALAARSRAVASRSEAAA